MHQLPNVQVAQLISLDLFCGLIISWFPRVVAENWSQARNLGPYPSRTAREDPHEQSVLLIDETTPGISIMLVRR